jgi:hypothetical protein
VRYNRHASVRGVEPPTTFPLAISTVPMDETPAPERHGNSTRHPPPRAGPHTLPTPADFRSRALLRFRQNATCKDIRSREWGLKVVRSDGPASR